jgi:mRNA interferase RelE/StbE
VRRKIEALAVDPTPVDSETLTGHPYRRVDVGEYRVIYDHDATSIRIARIGKRNDGEVYRNL